jgi:hypothetical protein
VSAIKKPAIPAAGVLSNVCLIRIRTPPVA